MFQIQHIHPMIVHFPIVFFLTLTVFDLAAVVAGRPVTTRSATANVSTGLAVLAGLFAVIAFVFGGMALDFAESNGFSSEIAEIHEGLGEATAAAFAIWALVRIFLWWRNRHPGGAITFAVPVIEIAGSVLVLVTAYYGGQLVYDLGVNVAHAAG